jgi:hypothetical protein
MGLVGSIRRLRRAGKGAIARLISLLSGFSRKHELAATQPERWKQLSDPVLAQITGRREPMGRAEAVLRLRLMGYEGFPSSPYDDRGWTHLYRYAGLFYVEVSISDTGMDLGWGPSLLPGGDSLYAGFAVEGWVEEQDCLDRLAPIAALDPDLPRAMAGLRVSGVPTALGLAALDVFCEVVSEIFHGWIDLNEVAAENRVAHVADLASCGKGVAA